MKSIKKYFIPLLASWLIRIIGLTIKTEVIGQGEVEELNSQGKRLIYAFWHGRQFLLAYHMRHRGIALMSSLSRDGDYQSRILHRLGYRIIRGSASRAGVSGLLGLIKEMKSGYDTTFAVDGPRGPLCEVKEGVIYAAKKVQANIVPVSSSAKKAQIFDKAWDKYLFPYPFTKGVIIFGQPYLISKEANIEEECKKLKACLDELTQEADERVKRNPKRNIDKMVKL